MANYLANENAKLYICDIYEDIVNMFADETRSSIVAPDYIYGPEVDIFSPCALGGVINDDTIPQLKCDIIAGAANNVVDAEDKHGSMPHEINFIRTGLCN